MPKVKVAIRLEVKIMILIPTPKFQGRNQVRGRNRVSAITQKLLKQI